MDYVKVLLDVQERKKFEFVEPVCKIADRSLSGHLTRFRFFLVARLHAGPEDILPSR